MSRNKLLWMPSEATIAQANMTFFTSFVNERHGLALNSYDELYQWSVENIPELWADIWDFTEIKASRGYDEVVDSLRHFPGARWFEGAQLNFAENLLRFRDDHLAFIFKGENLKSATMTYGELYDAVAWLSSSLREMGVQRGDRVAAPTCRI